MLEWEDSLSGICLLSIACRMCGYFAISSNTIPRPYGSICQIANLLFVQVIKSFGESSQSYPFVMEALNTFSRLYWDTPPVTRTYMTASVLTTCACQLEFISPLQLYFNPKLIFSNHQYWRLITTFIFFGPLGFHFLFNLIFTYRYCRMLEEDFYRNRTADFFFMFLIGGTLMSILAYFVNLLFLGHAFSIMLVYIWSRRNPSIRMNFFGMITFQAPYLSWVLLMFSIMIGSSTLVDIVGIVVGHFYYFFEDVFPNEPHGFRILETPRFIKDIFIRLGIDEPPLPEEERHQAAD